MNIKIGEKIKQLRTRDGRKQEDLANVLGVSPQAVSRWEACGGYPDMELIPAIANYFNVSIDELFGYDNDRGKKLKTILEKAENAIVRQQGDINDCVEMLRAAADEFPSEPKVFCNLGIALDMLGFEKHGIRSHTQEGFEYAFEDTEYNSQNEYLHEAIRAYEKALTLDIDADDRDEVIQHIVIDYTKMGDFDKAVSIASKQNRLLKSREVLLSHTHQGELRDKYQGEAIISLLVALKTLFLTSVGTKPLIFTKSDGTLLLTKIADLFETVFSDGRFGICHFHIGGVYLCIAALESHFGEDIEKAFEYFKKGFEHFVIYQSICGTGLYSYTAPLVSKVTTMSDDFPVLQKAFWKGWIERVLSDELKALIMSEPEIAEFFECAEN